MIGVIPVADNPECSEASDGAALDQTNRHREGVHETRTEHEYNAVAFLLFVETVHDDSPFGSSECMNKISTSHLRMEA